MEHLISFMKQDDLIKLYGIGNAHLLWAIGLYLDFPDLNQLEKESLTDRSSDRKIDFIRLDTDLKRITICQGYYTQSKTFKEVAPANKASDLNTAAAWLIDGSLNGIPEKLQTIIKECRQAIKDTEVERIELLYVHNCSESENVEQELDTAKKYLEGRLNNNEISVVCKELGVESLEKLYLAQNNSLVVLDRISCIADIEHQQSGPNWNSVILTLPGEWLWDQFNKYGDNLFSTNYRGFLGISKKRKINSGIKRTAEQKPENFLVYNNGITILTTKIEPIKEKNKTIGIYINGLSIINGAQTTGSIGQVNDRNKLKNVKVLCKVIETTDKKTIEEIVKCNNTQNVITTWDQYSNSPEQRRIQEELIALQHNYSLKRGFSNISCKLGIEQVAQPVLALHGDFQSANTGKNYIFENRYLYNEVFERVKGRHIIFAYTLSKGLEQVYGDLKDRENLTEFEEKQLSLLRNLKAKNFIIALVGETLETICNKQCDKHKVCFTYEASRADKYTLDELSNKWVPIIKTVISFVSGKAITDFTAFIKQENIMTKLSKELTSFIYSLKASSPMPAFDEFAKIVE